MDVKIHHQQILSDSAVSTIESKINSALAKFGHHVSRVELTVRDVNGPRGGIDKECKVMVKLLKLEDVVVTMKDASASTVVSQTIHRAERAVSRRIEKRTLRDRNQETRLA